LKNIKATSVLQSSDDFIKNCAMYILMTHNHPLTNI